MRLIGYFFASFLLVNLSLAKGPGSARLSIMTTNFENLFDTTHDRGKTDYTFLPLAVKRSMPEAMAWCGQQSGFYREECFNLDWTPETLARKLDRIAAVLKGAQAPLLPDVIVVQEVENLNVLSMVAKRLGRSYRAILIEGPDERGIDTGVITRLPVVRSRLHQVPVPEGRPTRGILEVVVRVGRKKVTIFGNHWPSQSNPDVNRMIAGKTLLGLSKQALRTSHAVVAAGDFNTAEDDELNALKTYIEPHFWDAENEAKRSGVDLGALATYSYKGVWASLDHIYIMKKPKRSKPDFSRVSIYTDGGRMIENYTYQGQAQSRPVRYNSETGRGYSDHLPLSMILKL